MSRLRSQSNADRSTNDIVANTQSARQRLEFAYDSQSRRVRKAVYQRETLNQQPETWVLKSDLRFVYDAWNLLAEFNMKLETSNLVLLRSYAWGYDLSGTEQGAGGIGGLVLVSGLSTTNSQPSTGAQAPCYDGNGNILAYLDCASGTITQRMEYDAFGVEMSLDSVLTQPSTHNAQLPFRFSTKYTDSETSLSYYGYRYYSAEMGRWMNRDPLTDQSFRRSYHGIPFDQSHEFESEAYLMCRNNTLNLWDKDGCFPPLLILAFSTFNYTKAGINACFAAYTCTKCVECWNEAHKWADHWYNEAYISRGQGEVFINYMNSNPAGHCAELCSNCGSYALESMIYVVFNVTVKYGIRRHGGGHGSSFN
jgi:RHS repeat-associated protein